MARSADGDALFIRVLNVRTVMRVLHVSKKLPPVVGGDATAVAALGRAQRRRGHQVEFLAYRGPGIVEEEGTYLAGPPLSADELDRMSFRRYRAMRALGRWARANLERLRPDLVHAHAADVGTPLSQVAHELHLPVVLTCHGVWFPTRSRWSPAGLIERSLIRRGRYASITTVDRFSVRALKDLGFRDAILVPNGVDAAEFAGPRQRDGPLRFLFVGRHVFQKGIDRLLEAAARVRPRIVDGFVLELAGDGPERPRLERRARDLDLGRKVRFLGSLDRPQLLEAYRRADVFVLPSRFEGFPLVILEAWSAGLPVIATSVGGVPDLCGPRNSVLVPSDDLDALGDAMVSLAQDSARREALGAAGRSVVLQHYTWDAIADRYEEVYERSLGRTRAAER